MMNTCLIGLEFSVLKLEPFAATNLFRCDELRPLNRPVPRQGYSTVAALTRSGRPCVCRVRGQRAELTIGSTHSADARPATTGAFEATYLLAPARCCMI